MKINKHQPASFLISIVIQFFAVLIAICAMAIKLDGAQQANAQGNLADLIREGKVTTRIYGEDIQTLSISLGNKTPGSIEILIPAGTYFVSADSEVQNMVSTEDKRVTLEAAGKNTLKIAAACANRGKKIPRKGWDVFDIGSPPNGNELVKLAAAMSSYDSYPVKQAAVWIVTDNAEYYDLGTLTSGIGSQSAFPFSAQPTSSQFHGPRLINEYGYLLDACYEKAHGKRAWRTIPQT